MEASRSIVEVPSPQATDSEPAKIVPVAVRPQPVPPDAGLSHPSLYFNRELSWIDFNWRVLYQALDERTPLLERVRFLSITQSNLDEFFAKRVGGLLTRLSATVSHLSLDGRTPAEQLELVRGAITEMQTRLSSTWERGLKPLLEEQAGVSVVRWSDLTAAEQAELTRYFRTSIFPILTPLAVDPGHPFPFISHLSLSLAITLLHPKRGTEHFARVKVPLNLGRWVRVGAAHCYIAIEELIAEHTAELFPGMQVASTHCFRVTRNAELDYEREDTEDLLESIAEELLERRFAPVVRLEVDSAMPNTVRELLIDELELSRDAVYEVEGMLDLSSLSTFADLDIPGLRFEPWEPVVPPALAHVGVADGEGGMFGVIRSGDLLVHHPYESFAASVERFIDAAATDPRVLAIKQTLYRVSDDSRVARALIRAAEEGKQVAVLVELTASLDEERNIELAERMESAGVHVTYGVVGLKTHTKITLVVREDPDGIHAYVHVGSGNYHERTARLYTDIGLFTAAPEISHDVVNLFHYLTGFAPDQKYDSLLVAPAMLRARLLELVEQEVALGPRGRIILKMNAIDDREMIQALYRASMAGVRIDLIVRGHTRLRPGLPHFSENIRLISILGRFLEHDRIFYFHNGGNPQVFIGSADWRRRNLDERIEAVVPVRDPALQQRLLETLEAALSDNRSVWELRPDGRYVLQTPAPGEAVRAFQEIMMQRARAAAGSRVR